MSPNVRSVAVVGSGVIGASWAYLFLTKGLRVVMSDPAEGAEDSFKKFITEANAESGGSAGDLQKLLDRFEFVDDITPHLPKVDFVQEVMLL
jgi:3-hydroxyacyl-CoA dehydrogenase